MSVLALSGWGQPHDSLSAIVPEATHVDYAHYQLDEALTHIAEQGKDKRVIVGWSLGGQLAVRAIAAGMLQPKALVLIAAPFQFVASQEPLGMKRDLYEKFRDNYARNPARTLDKAWELVVKDDARHEHVRSHIARQDKQAVMQRNWLYWLNALDGFSCDTLDMQAFPHTLLVYGQKDSVVAHEQHTHFAQRLPHADIISLPECGHAPHWHDGQVIAHWVSKHV